MADIHPKFGVLYVFNGIGTLITALLMSLSLVYVVYDKLYEYNILLILGFSCWLSQMIFFQQDAVTEKPYKVSIRINKYQILQQSFNE